MCDFSQQIPVYTISMDNIQSILNELQHTDPKLIYTDENGRSRSTVRSGQELGQCYPVHHTYSEVSSFSQCDSGYEKIGEASTANLLSSSEDSAIDVCGLNFDGPEVLPVRTIKRAQDSRRRLRSKSTVTSQSSSQLDVKRQRYCKAWIYVLFVVTILSLVLAATCFALTLRFITTCDKLEQKVNSLQTSLTLAQQDSHLCLPCAKLQQGPFTEDNIRLDSLLKKEENGSVICCAKSADQFLIMLDLFAERKQKEHQAEEILRNENKTSAVCNDSCNNTKPSGPTSSVSAHLVAGEQDSDDGMAETKGMQPIQYWLSGEPGTHLTNINIIAGSRLVVPETGNYFLYSQVGFMFYYDSNQNVEARNQSVFHIVYRYNAIYPLDGSQELLRGELTQCWEKQKSFGRYTSYVAGSLRLNKGDQIYVTVSRIQDLSRKPHITYIGLFKIS